MLGTAWRTISWSYYVIPIIIRQDFIIIILPFRPSALFSVIRDLATAALPYMLDLWTSPPTVCAEKVSSRWILSSAVTFAATVQWFLDTILFSVWRSLSLPFGIWPLFLLADVLPWFVYAVITLETASLDTPNNVPVFFRDAPVKQATSVCPLWKSDKSRILQYFHTNRYWTHSTMHWHWHYTV